jgi:hypothetical protein
VVLTSARYGTIGLLGVGVFVVAIVALHVLQPELSVVDEYMSVYALGAYGWLLQIGAIALGLAIIVVALGLRRTLAAGRRATAAWLALVIAGLGFVAAGVFVTDPTGTTDYTLSGAIHDLAGFLSLLSLVTAAWLLWGAFSRTDGYQHLARTQLLLAGVLTIVVVTLLAGLLPVGIAQRTFYIVLVGWMFVLAVSVRRLGVSPRASEPNSNPSL